MKNDRDYILNYYKQSYMNNYFVDITDYNIYNNQVLLQGDESVLKWIKNINFFDLKNI